MAGRKMHPSERVADYVDQGWWTGDTVQRLFSDRVAEFGDELAIVDPPNKAELVDLPLQRLSWNSASDQVERIAAVLLANGIGEGDVLAVQLPNIVEQVLTYLAGWRIGAIVSPLPVPYRTHEIVELGNIAKISAFVTADRIGKRAVLEEVLGVRTDISTLRTVLYFGPSDIPDATNISTAVAQVSAKELATAAAYADAHPADPNDCLTICWTSGTESRPKGVPRAHYEWLLICRDTVYAPGLTHESRILNPFPLVNMAGINGMLLPWLRVGCVLLQHHPFDLEVFLAQVQNERVTYTVAPPALLAMLLQREELLASADISSLRQIGSGSVPLQEWMVQGWFDRHGVTIINFFGSNEGLSLITDVKMMTEASERARFFPRYGVDRPWTSPSSQYTTIKLIDPETGAEVDEPHHPAELYLKGPSVFAGYLDAPNVANPFDPDGYLKSGDMFVIDGPNNEYLRYVDRSKDLIIRGGMNVAPAELETLIATHPNVADVAVVGYPDDLLGEKACAIVVLKPGTTLTLGQVVGHLTAQNIASFKLPERLELRDSLPRNPVGKILKRQLRDEMRDAAHDDERSR